MIRVEATAVHPADLIARSGGFAGVIAPREVYRPGWDFYGRVHATGPDVDDLTTGDPVVGMTDWLRNLNGTHAEYVLLPRDAVVPAPVVIYPYAPVSERGITINTVGVIVGAPSHSYLDAPVRPDSNAYPVVIYAHGLQGNRTNNTAVVEELTSHGYVVVAVDSTYEAAAVEFPDGRLIKADSQKVREVGIEAIAALRVDDTKFLLDELEAGRQPDSLRGALDLDRIGMFGHSMGGAATAGSMFADERIDAGVDLDGFILGPVATAGLGRPFLLMGSDYHTPEGDPTWGTFIPQLRDWRQWLRVDQAGHYSFTDYGGTARDWGLKEQLPPEQWYNNFGEIDGQRAIEIHSSYTLAFFDRFLRGQDPELLKGPSSDWPEVSFQLS